MKTETIIALLRLRAVEESDPRGELIGWGEREDATRQALRLVGKPKSPSNAAEITESQWQFLSARADVLHMRASELAGEMPRLGQIGLWGRGVCLTALILGFVSHGAGLSRNFNLIAAPFLVLIVWNTIVYAMLCLRMFPTSRKTNGLHVIGHFLEKRIDGLFGDMTHHKARMAFAQAVKSWLRSWSAPALVTWFHAGSACFVVGLLVAIYYRGLNQAYFVGWESTWLSPETVKTVIGGLLSPASWISGIEIPASAEVWRQLNWHSNVAKIPANPWIHLYAITLILWIVIPRILLAAASQLRATRLRTAAPAWHGNDGYVRRILSQAQQDGDVGIAILPFDFKQPATITSGNYRDAIERLVRETWGQGGRARWLPHTTYGEEEAVFDGAWSDATPCGGAVLLCDLGATPEEEVHGALVEQVMKHFAERGGVLIAVESAQISSARYDSQFRLWHEFAARRSCAVLSLEKGNTREAGVSPHSQLNRINEPRSWNA